MNRERLGLSAMCASIFLSGAAPLPSQEFAIKCVGKAQFEDNIRGKVSKRHYNLPPQVYVFDPSSKRAELAMETRQQFDPICFKGGYIESVDFHPGLLAVRSEGPGRFCDFRINRKTGRGAYFRQDDLDARRYSRINYQLNCKRTDVPQFDLSGNQF